MLQESSCVLIHAQGSDEARVYGHIKKALQQFAQVKQNGEKNVFWVDDKDGVCDMHMCRGTGYVHMEVDGMVSWLTRGSNSLATTRSNSLTK